MGKSTEIDKDTLTSEAGDAIAAAALHEAGSRAAARRHSHLWRYGARAESALRDLGLPFTAVLHASSIVKAAREYMRDADRKVAHKVLSRYGELTTTPESRVGWAEGTIPATDYDPAITVRMVVGAEERDPLVYLPMGTACAVFSTSKQIAQPPDGVPMAAWLRALRADHNFAEVQLSRMWVHHSKHPRVQITREEDGPLRLMVAAWLHASGPARKPVRIWSSVRWNDQQLDARVLVFEQAHATIMQRSDGAIMRTDYGAMVDPAAMAGSRWAIVCPADILGGR